MAQRFCLVKSDFVQRRFAAHSFIVMGNFFEPLGRDRYSFRHTGEEWANFLQRSGAAEGDEQYRIIR